MKPGPLLIGATLLFWGWQINLPWAGAVMGILVELAWLIKVRWDFSNEDFERIWTLCSLMLLAMILFVFTNNEGLSAIGGMVENPNFNARQDVSLATARTASNVLRWLPIVFFPFLLAQTFSTRESIPLATISHLLQRRWKIARQTGHPMPPGRGFNISYPYFGMTLLAACFHPAENNTYFYGFCGLLCWALWMLRPRRYSPALWITIMLVTAGAGYFGQRGITQAQRYLVALNAQWLARLMQRGDDPFVSRTAIGRIGFIKNSSAIAVRLQPRTPRAVPAYLREASYRQFEKRSWFAGTSLNDFIRVDEVFPSPTNHAYWPFLPDKAASNVVQIACYLESVDEGVSTGLLPLPTGTARVEKFPGYGMRINSAGAVLALGQPLVIFEAHYGPGETFDSSRGSNSRRNCEGQTNAEATNSSDVVSNQAPAEPDLELRRSRRERINEDLSVPEEEKPALDTILAELQLTSETDHRQVLNTLAGFFQEKFTYRTWQRPRRPREGETHVGRFLLETRAGHCEYFATATVLLLRQLGIPARYATGYAVHEKSGEGYVVRYSDAHAWTLVWNPKEEIWEDFETTPPSWVKIESRGVPFFRWLGDAWERFKYEFARFRYGQSPVRRYLIWIIAPGLIMLLYQILFRRGRTRKQTRPEDEAFFANLPGLDSDFYRLEQQLAARGVMRGPAEPLSDWLRRVLKTPGLAGLRAPLEQLLRLHYRHRFDPLGLNVADRESLRRETNRCLAALAEVESAPATAVGSAG